MDLDLNQEQNILKTSAQKFFKEECPLSLMKDMRDDDKGYPPALWEKIAELGWMGVLIPEEYGGVGGNFVDLSIILECMGEVCAPVPFFSTVVLGGLAILSAGSNEQKKDILPKISNGDIILTLALTEPGAWYETSCISTQATQDKDEYIINGTKLFVENANIADYILCAARTDSSKNPEQGLTLFLIDSKSPGIKCEQLKTFTYDKQYEVIFDNVRVPKANIIGRQGDAWDMLKTLQEQAAIAKCAEMVGCIQTAFNMTVEYAKIREQFGRPIGSFQAVQHHCANMVLDVDGSRFLTYKAAWKITEGLPIRMDAAMAKAMTSDASRRVTTLAHQIFGAVAFCEEHDLHLFYRRAKAGEVALGDANYHLEQVACELGL